MVPSTASTMPSPANPGAYVYPSREKSIGTALAAASVTPVLRSRYANDADAPSGATL